MNEDSIILESFSSFVIKNKLIESSDFEATVDEVIGSYVVNTIKQLFEEYENHKIWLDDNAAEEFDIESFVEIIDAYLCGFNTLEKNDIVHWLIDLKNYIDSEKQNELEVSDKTETDENLSIEVAQDSDKKVKPKDKKIDANDPNIELLTEMFPSVSINEINKLYKKVNKSYEKAVDELLILQNSGSVLSEDSDEDLEARNELNEEERKLLKEKTLQKFGFVEVNEDGSVKAAAPPKANWNSEKKLVRYYDSKVVSTKGEKYFELKTEEEEELAKQMKKTYVNLKPARKYRFH